MNIFWVNILLKPKNIRFIIIINSDLLKIFQITQTILIHFYLLQIFVKYIKGFSQFLESIQLFSNYI